MNIKKYLKPGLKTLTTILFAMTLTNTALQAQESATFKDYYTETNLFENSNEGIVKQTTYFNKITNKKFKEESDLSNDDSIELTNYFDNNEKKIRSE